MIYFSFLLIFLSGFCIGYGLSAIRRTDLLANHVSGTPFTAAELKSIGIKPPEDYDEWLARR